MDNFDILAHASVENNTATEAVKRAVDMDNLAKKAGFSTYEGSKNGQTLYAWGTELMESGKEAWRSKATLHDAKPFVGEIVESFQEVIKNEKREDRKRDMQGLVLDSNGRLIGRDILTSNPNANGMPVSRWALGQLLNRSEAPSGSLNVIRPQGVGQTLDPSLVSSIFASYMAGAKTAKGRNKDVKLRTRMTSSGREVFAAQSPRSPSFDADLAIAAFAADAHPTAKGTAQYDGRKWKFSSEVRSHIEPTVGEIFEGSVWISGTDDGSSAIHIGAEVVRVRCINLTTLSSVDIENIRHHGRQLNFEERIKAALSKAHAKIEAFAEVWANAERQEIADNAAQHGIDKVFDLMVKKRLVYVPGVEHDMMVGRLMQAWTSEPGYNKADVLNAVTRAAHSNTWDNPWATENLAEQAGKLLYRQVYFTGRDFSLLEV